MPGTAEVATGLRGALRHANTDDCSMPPSKMQWIGGVGLVACECDSLRAASICGTGGQQHAGLVDDPVPQHWRTELGPAAPAQELSRLAAMVACHFWQRTNQVRSSSRPSLNLKLKARSKLLSLYPKP